MIVLNIEFSFFNGLREKKMTNLLWHLKEKVVGVVESFHLIGIQELWHKKIIEEKKKQC